MDYKIDKAKSSDHEKIHSICRQCSIKDGNLLDMDVPTMEALDTGCIGGCSFVARKGDQVVGWAAMMPFPGREDEKDIARVSVFVSPENRRQGIGKALLASLIEASQKNYISSMRSMIIRNNIPGLILHKKMGFRALGIYDGAGTIKGKESNAVTLERKVWM